MTLSPQLSKQLQWAAQGLQAVGKGQSSTEWLEQCPSALRPGVQALLLTALRDAGATQALRVKMVPKPPAPAVDALLRLGLSLLRQDPPMYSAHTLVSQLVEAAKLEPRARALAPLINACLRRYTREREDLEQGLADDVQARWNHPEWWVRQLQKDHPEQWMAILAQARQRPPMVLRLNLNKVTLSDWLQRCAEAAIDARPLGDAAVWLPQPVPVQLIPGFAQGECSVQDAAAQRAAPLLLDALGPTRGRPWRVLDACAAPGGKTAHLLEHGDVEVLALDVDEKRLQRVQENLQRLGLQAATRVANAALPGTWAAPGEWFDGILLDAPCSASGIVRRHPDIPWLRRPSDLAGLAAQQKALLEGLWPLLRPGGVLLYCTCSVFKIEGEDQAQAFVAHNTNARRQAAPGHLLPVNERKGGRVGDNMACEADGFFYALFQKEG